MQAEIIRRNLQLDHGPACNMKQPNTAYRARVKATNTEGNFSSPRLIHAAVSCNGQELVAEADAASADEEADEY
jgi:hypothetical protein